MDNPFTRRDALKGMISTGAEACIKPSSTLIHRPAIQVSAHPVEIALTSISAQPVRIAVQILQDEKPLPIPDDGALCKEQWGHPIARVRATDSSRTIKCGDLNVTLSDHPLTIRVERTDGGLVQELALDSTSLELRFLMGNGAQLGMGQGGPQFDRRGSKEAMVSGQGGYELGTHGARVPIQLLIGTVGWGMFVHHPLGSFDWSGDHGRLIASDDEGAWPFDVFVIGAKQPAAILAEYAKITGFAEMPPLWSLGYQQSYRTLGTPEEIMQEAKTFRDKQLPYDTMIYPGTGFCPNGWNTYNGEFEWNKAAFPDPQKAIDQLHAEHFKVALHVVLEGRHLTGSVSDPWTAVPLPSGRTPDHHWPPDRQVSCYWPAHRPLADMGVDDWRPDQGGMGWTRLRDWRTTECTS